MKNKWSSGLSGRVSEKKAAITAGELPKDSVADVINLLRYPKSGAMIAPSPKVTSKHPIRFMIPDH